MATIDDIIKQSLNPFGNLADNKFAAGNFWEEESTPTVESIHQNALMQIKSILDAVAKDHQTRTLILYGDIGIGKTYFMGRLKKQLNNQGFFAYIEPFPQSDHIWQHILRYTVDSLVNVPAGKTDSQLILWLKDCFSSIQNSLKNEQQKSILEKVKNVFWQSKSDSERDRKLFIDVLKKTIGIGGIYNANEFFGVLYALTDPDLYSLACEWLKGDSLDEDSLKQLKVEQSIDNEDKARGILGNFSKISAKTKPIVLCFDNLDSIARLPDGLIDLQALFNVNSAIYNGKWKGFLIIISIRTESWNNNYKRIQPSDLDRISDTVHLKRISIEEAEGLWETRLYHFYNQANPKPTSPSYPLNTQVLLKRFPSKKAIPRAVLTLGQCLLQEYKVWLAKDKQPPKPEWLDGIFPDPKPDNSGHEDKIKAEFQLLWQQEFKKNQGKISKITLLAASELIRMLTEALEALQVQQIKPRLLSGKNAGNSLSYQKPSKPEQIGIVWTEDANMNGFYNAMNACKKVIEENSSRKIYLIRLADVGKPNMSGNKIYNLVFRGTHHQHIKPSLPSVHYLATYHNFVNSALANELVIGGKVINLQELQALVRETKILHECRILQELGIVQDTGEPKKIKSETENWKPVKDWLLNVVITQQFMGRPALVNNAHKQFPELYESEIENLVNQLCTENKIKIMNPKAKLEEQTVCLVIAK